MLNNIRVVLVETSHTGNMGSVARAMKTMGLSQLWLVNPQVKPDSQAIALAAGASEVIGDARIVDTLDEALTGCGLVMGTSARERSLSWPGLTARQCGEKCVAQMDQTPVALVFGRERVGLTNAELQKCHYQVSIAANPRYSSLNLAMAVQIISYEVHMAWLAARQANGVLQAIPAAEQPFQSSALPSAAPLSVNSQPLASAGVGYPLAEDLERFYQHLQRVLQQTAFIRPNHPGQVMNKLRRLFNRARPESQELNILRGMLTAIEQHYQRHD